MSEILALTGKQVRQITTLILSNRPKLAWSLLAVTAPYENLAVVGCLGRVERGKFLAPVERYKLVLTSLGREVGKTSLPLPEKVIMTWTEWVGACARGRCALQVETTQLPDPQTHMPRIRTFHLLTLQQPLT